MKINFIGDLIFGDQPMKFGYGFDSQHSGNGYRGVFNNVKQIFSDSDFSVGNFESVIKCRPENSNVSNWSMCCDERIVQELRHSQIDILNMANNHTMDYGKKWFDYTKNKLLEAGIKVIGLKEKPYVILKKSEEHVAIIGVSYIRVKESKPLYFNSPSLHDWKVLMEELDSLGVQKRFLYIHWGNEFIFKPSSKQIDILYDLERFSFDAIIGHHSHILQDSFRFSDIPVFCSLGNFISDYWQMRARKTIILQHDVSSSEFYKITCTINDEGLPEVQSGNEKITLSTYQGDIATIEEINKERKRLRLEFLNEIVFRGYRIKNKKYFFKWIFKRAKFLIKNYRLEKKNPDIIYEKYEP